MIDTPRSIAYQMGMKWRISRLLLDRLRRGERAGHPRETCGLLLGAEGRILDALPIRNVAADPRSAFELDPAAHLAASRAARASGMAVFGHYHSHPGGDPSPSRADAEQAGEQGRLWLILAGDEHGLWLSREGGPVAGAFERMELEIV
jgi:proteasome lid subunit RPN8/RPN11